MKKDDDSTKIISSLVSTVSLLTTTLERTVVILNIFLELYEEENNFKIKNSIDYK